MLHSGRTPAIIMAAALSACSGGPIELRGTAEKSAKVIIDREPFALHIFDGDEREVLSTYPTENGAYGTPASTVDHYEEEAQLIPGWDGYRAKEGEWKHVERISIEEKSEHHAKLELLSKDGATIGTLEINIEGQRVRLALRALQSNKTSLSFAARPEERFFGMGERYASVDHRGLSLYSWAEEGGLGKGESAPLAADNPYPNGPSMTYYPLAFSSPAKVTRSI